MELTSGKIWFSITRDDASNVVSLPFWFIKKYLAGAKGSLSLNSHQKINNRFVIWIYARINDFGSVYPKTKTRNEHRNSDNKRSDIKIRTFP